MARFYRTLVGPVIIGVSVWCAAGTVAVLSNASSTDRVVALAPWWIGLVAAAIAALVPTWRTRPSTTLPALISTLPWWPVPLPAIALVWTGPLAWMPIIAAVLVAVGSSPLAWLSRAFGAHEPVRATRLAAIASLIVAIGAAWAANPRVPGGDEPHYLVITQSLLKDGDLKIENNHAARDYSAYFGGEIRPDYLARGRDGAIYSIHAPGVSALVLPAFALFGFRGAQATVILLFAIAGALMWRTAWRLTGDTSAAWFAWAAVAGSTTMAVLSFMIFPETPGACAVAAGVWLLVAHRDASNRVVIAVSAALAVLPWLHTRFSVLAGAIGVAVVVMLLADGTRLMAARWRRAFLFIAIPAVSAVAWLSMFYVLYGTWDPRAPYGPDPELRPWIWGAVAGLFVDEQFGLLTYAPILFFAFVGCVMAAPRQWRLLSALCVGVVLVYAMAVASYWMWWAGVPGLPARFLTAALPLLSVPLAVAWARSTATGRTLLLALLAVSLGVTVMILAVDRSVMAWNFRDGQAAWLEWLSPVVNLPRAWPSFFWNGDGAFLRHAAILLSIAVIIGLGIRPIARRYSSNPPLTRLVAAVLMLTGLMAVVQVGWTVSGSAPLDPARAQMRVHAAAGVGQAVWQVGRGIHRWDSSQAPLRITPDQAPLSDAPSATVLALVNVPAGLYHLETTSGSLSGALLVRIRRSAPLERVQVATAQSQSFPLVLPAGAALLVVEAESADLAQQLQVALVPASAASPRRGYAREYRRYSDAEAFFLDGDVFPEAEGFWVRGGRTTEVVLSQGSSAANRTGTLTLRNGAAANTVTIQSGAWQEVLALAAGEARVVALPTADALGSWPLTITSASGFRPSDTAGEDRRFLGVWISR
jgi:hypothetical protein